MSPYSSLRKAAILLSTLDDPTAGALLDQMAPDQVDLVRQAMDELGVIEQVERDHVIDEFFRTGAFATSSDSPREVLRPAQRGTKSASLVEDELELGGSRPFHFLEETDSTELIPFLADEHPQTIAVVLSHMPPARATAVLADLPAALQADVVRRLVDLDETHPAIVREVERGLESRISSQARCERRRAAGVAAVARIFEAADRRLVQAILSNLAAHDRELADQFVRPSHEPPLRYEDLAALDDETLLTIYGQAGPELALLALAGSSMELVDRIVARLSSKHARRLRHELDHLGPTRLSDVEQAQQELVRLAEQMSHQRSDRSATPITSH